VVHFLNPAKHEAGLLFKRRFSPRSHNISRWAKSYCADCRTTCTWCMSCSSTENRPFASVHFQLHQQGFRAIAVAV